MALLAALLLVLGGCTGLNVSDMAFTSFNNLTNITIHLGMKKADVDKTLSSIKPEADGSYRYGNLKIRYDANNTVIYLMYAKMGGFSIWHTPMAIDLNSAWSKVSASYGLTAHTMGLANDKYDVGHTYNMLFDSKNGFRRVPDPFDNITTQAQLDAFDGNYGNYDYALVLHFNDRDEISGIEMFKGPINQNDWPPPAPPT